MSMNKNSAANLSASENPQPLPPWSECDFFCIHDYAGTGASPCGWRGRIHDARSDQTELKPLCPRCGCATLFRIPLDRVDTANS